MIERHVGRRTKLTPEVQTAICEALEAGNYRQTAALYAGICERTLYQWLQNAEEGRGEPYSQFAQALKNAEAHGEVRDLAVITKATETQWQAAAWKLERKYPDRWGRRDVTRLEGGLAIKQTVVSLHVSDDVLRQALETLALAGVMPSGIVDAAGFIEAKPNVGVGADGNP